MSEPGPEIVQRAAEWLAHLESGDATDADHRRCSDWLAADPSHQTAFHRLGGFSRTLEAEPLQRDALRRLFPRRSARIAPAILIAALLGGSALLGYRSDFMQIRVADQRTAAGELRAVPLADGSEVTLATRSAANIDLGPARRHITLVQGEILARVRPDQARPFVVETGDGTITALGTAFTVFRGMSGTDVAVIESHVRACPADAGSSACVDLAPGQRARMTREHVALRAGNAGDDAAWADGWLPVQDRPLPEVLGEINRWRAEPIDFQPDKLASLRVSGLFSLKDTDRALSNLGALLPIAIDRSADGQVAVRPATEK